LRAAKVGKKNYRQATFCLGKFTFKTNSCHMKRLLLCLCLFCVLITAAQTSCPPFWNDIVQFKKADSAQVPPKGAILFVGSSSFTRWKDVDQYFPGYTIINRGFGGSILLDVIRYAYDIILPYQPKQVVIYCGENDLGSGLVKAEEVANRFKTLFGIIRQNLPHARINFVSIKPSPSRQRFFSEMQKANSLIGVFLKSQQNAAFINVFDAMLDSNGNPPDDLFVEDRLHMTAKGYAIWQKIIQPYLLK
jgi:lysophospholipase L1-like esterase